jgi:hypothetical protein
VISRQTYEGGTKMVKKEYSHLVKPMLVQQGPAGLYPEPLVWMEAKDLEGFNACFSYGFIKEPCVCHPMEGMIVHPYDEILVFAGYQDGNILRLDAEISIVLGEEREVHRFHKPSIVLIPKGTPHGAVTVEWVDRPIIHYTISLATEYKATSMPMGQVTKGEKHAHLIKPLLTNLLSMAKTMTGAEAGPTYAKIMDERGILHPAVGGVGPGNGDDIVWLFGDNLEGMDVNFTWGLYSQCGKWHRAGEAHTHPEEEILCYVGLDPNDINHLGAELELGMGKDYERHVFNKPTVAICPQGFPHLPLITRWVDKPYGFFVICLSGEHDSPWVEA